MHRPSPVRWNVQGGRSVAPAPFLIMGVVNVTPDSFYDGGTYTTHQAVETRLEDVLKQGGHILDIGGESTRPFADPVTLEQELERVLPVVRSAVARDVLVSIDTYKAPVAAQALEAGAHVVNDVSACVFDPALKDVLAQYKPGYVLMHSQGNPGDMQVKPAYTDVISEVLCFFENKLRELTQAGLPEDNIVLDPGIGFGKLLEHNITLLKHVERFHEMGRPLLVGLSNKSLWGGLLGLESHERKNATQAATAIMAQKGVQLHRVHEVNLTAQTLRVVQELA